MDIYFPKDTLKALRTAGCKSPGLVDEEAIFRGKAIDSRNIIDTDLPIIMKIVKQPVLWETIENRRIFQKVEAWQTIASGGHKSAKVKKLEMLPDIVRELLKPTPHRWVFVEDRTLGVQMPAFVTHCSYHPPRNERGDYSPATVSLVAKSMARGEEESTSVTFKREDLKGTAVEILGQAGILIETPELVAEYEASMVRYRVESEKTGEQYLARGTGRLASESKWSREEVHFEREGRPAKVVMDDEIERGTKEGYSNTKFWSKTPGDDDDEEGEEAFPLPVQPVVRVFDLEKHDFYVTHIDNVEAYRYDMKAVEKLVLPADHKELIDALTGSASERMDDIVQGKARGIIIICSGKPGTGKTLSAEVYSEAMKRPLYTVQCSQLGIDEKHLENKLSEVLERATRWRAILLIDEADVYIHERGSDLVQNAVVGVFLRLLEYFSGILFLNTNRVTVIDDAILSRATAHIKYDVPKDEEARRRIWEILAEHYGAGGIDTIKAAKEFVGISGRSVRQLIRLAKIVADRNGKKTTLDLVRWAAKFQDFTERDEEAK